MKKLRVSDDLALPLDTVTSTLVVYGGKGMGKTNFASVLVEEIDANGLRFAFLDPVGVSWGLRHSLDGKGRGIEILILGGIHGDIPIEPTGGAVVADLVVDESVNVLIDISRRPDGSMWSIGERIRFVTDYTKRLYQRQGEKRRPIMQVIDEAARFAPQTVRKNEDNITACMGAIAVLVEEGRNVGIGVTLLTLRSARLNKDVAELADCMIAFRTVGPNSRGAVLEWLGEHVEQKRVRELDETIRKLPVGSALVVSPGWLNFEGVVAFRARRTFDSSKTPKPGETVRASGPGAKPDLPKYQERMAETIERAKESDPKELRKKNADLQKRIAELERDMKLAVEHDRQDYPTQHAYDKACEALNRTKEQNAALKDANREIVARIDRIGKMFARAFKINEEIAGELLKDAPKLPEIPVAAPAPQPVPTYPGRPTRVVATRPTSLPRNGGGDLGKCERAILRVLASYPDGLQANQLTLLTGYRYSGGFKNALSTLRVAGLMTGENTQTMQLTSEGLSVAGGPQTLPSGDELRSYWLSHPSLGECERAVLEVLLATRHGLTAAELCEATGYQYSGGFKNALSTLRTANLITGKNTETPYRCRGRAGIHRASRGLRGHARMPD